MVLGRIEWGTAAVQGRANRIYRCVLNRRIGGQAKALTEYDVQVGNDRRIVD